MGFPVRAFVRRADYVGRGVAWRGGAVRIDDAALARCADATDGGSRALKGNEEPTRVRSYPDRCGWVEEERIGQVVATGIELQQRSENSRFFGA